AQSAARDAVELGQTVDDGRAAGVAISCRYRAGDGQEIELLPRLDDRSIDEIRRPANVLAEAIERARDVMGRPRSQALDLRNEGLRLTCCELGIDRGHGQPDRIR